MTYTIQKISYLNSESLIKSLSKIANERIDLNNLKNQNLEKEANKIMKKQCMNYYEVYLNCYKNSILNFLKDINLPKENNNENYDITILNYLKKSFQKLQFEVIKNFEYEMHIYNEKTKEEFMECIFEYLTYENHKVTISILKKFFSIYLYITMIHLISLIL